MRVAVDAEICTGHGCCHVLAPHPFGPDEYGHCEILVGDGVVPDGLEDSARIGHENCPEQAITIED